MQNKKVLIIGSQGMLGAEFVRQLHARGKGEVVGWGKAELDITNEQEVMEKISALKPNVILNCAAYNNVDKAEDEPEVANIINGEAVGYLAKAAGQVGATFVHFSTDYVFGGGRNGAYNEEDIPDPVSKYGESKALGEQRVFSVFCHPESASRADEGSRTHVRGVHSDEILRSTQNDSNRKWYVIRTSKLFGPAGSGVTSKKSFPEMMLGFARAKGRIEAIDAEVGSPTYVKDLVEATLNLIGIAHSPSPESPPIKGGETNANSSPLMGEVRRGWQAMSSGIYHITNSGACTWYEYAKVAVESAGVVAEVVPVGPEKFPRKAKRPANSTLLNTKLPPLRPWQEALNEFLKNKVI